MNRFVTFVSSGFMFAFALASEGAQASAGGFAADSFAYKPLQWMTGDSWKVIVEAYAGIPELAIADPTKRPRVPHVFAKYSMLIRVVGSIPYSNSVCWVVDFLPDGSAPEAIKEQRYRVLVSQDGFMRKVELRSAATDPVAFETFGGMMFLRHMLPGFPIQMLPPHPNNGTVLERSGRRRHLIFGNTSKGQERLVEGRLETVGRDGGTRSDCVVKQTWAPGAKWWTTYVSYVHGELHTRAWRENAEPPSIATLQPPPANGVH